MTDAIQLAEIKRWGSQRSYGRLGSNLIEQPKKISNLIHEADDLVARPPNKLVMDNTTAGIIPAIGGGTFFKTTGVGEKIFGTANGKLWVHRNDGDAPIELTLSGSSALPASTIKIRCEQYFNLYYIVTGSTLLEYDGNSDTVVNRTNRLPSGITQPIAIRTFNDTRLALGNSPGQIMVSKFEANLQSDTNPFDTTLNAGFQNSIANGDGLQINNITVASGVMAISKQLLKHKKTKIWSLKGKTPSDYEIELTSPVDCFVGDTAVGLRNDIVGLTLSGISYLKELQASGQGETTTSSQTGKLEQLPDWVLDRIKDVNLDYLYKAVGHYSTLDKAYYLAIPIGKNTDYNNLVIRVCFEDGEIRYSELDWQAQVFFELDGFLYFIDDRGKMWKTFSWDEESYEEGVYHKLVITDALKPEPLFTGTNKPVLNYVAEYVEIGVEAYQGDISVDENDLRYGEMFLDIFHRSRKVTSDYGTLFFETNKNAMGKNSGNEVIKPKRVGEATTETFFLDLDTTDHEVVSKDVIIKHPLLQNVKDTQIIISNNGAGLENVFRLKSFKLFGNISPKEAA